MDKETQHDISKYRLSKFIIRIEKDDEWLLYNSVTGGIVLLKGEDDLIESLGSLIEMKFYVPLEFDEYKWIKDMRKQPSPNETKRSINGFTILTSTDCNARCYYCYEKGQRRISMSEKIANDTADYIAKVSDNSPVDIRWFGGEPLFNTRAIDIICNSLISKGVEYKSTMVSNGLLFTDSNIIKAKELWRVRNVQITLDGTKDVYQKAKAYKGAKGDEFDKVINNIKKLIDTGIHVSIRLNQGDKNTEDLIQLVEYLSTEFGRRKKEISVYNSLLFGSGEDSSVIDSKTYNNFLRLQDKILDCNFFRKNVLKGELRIKHCMADNDSSIIITPEGNLGKCEHFTDTHIIGSIYSSEFDNTEIQKWKETLQPEQKCFSCALYPQCVRIKMCPIEGKHCSLTQCENKLYLIKRALLKKLKESNESDSY